MKGTITNFQGNNIVLKVEGKEFDYIADKRLLERNGILNPEIGQQIIFQEGNRQGNNVKVSKILDKDIANQEDLFEKVNLPERPEKLYLNNNKPFSNPYNFVSVVKVPDDKAPDDKVILFRKPFVPHDKYQGKSGVITCRLKTLTPFFTSATHEEKERGEHKHLDFFSTDKEKINGKENKWRMPIVSGSTLRGVIRSVCEAVSNSTFTALSSEILDYRAINKASGLECGIITKLPINETVGEIKLLESAKLPFGEIPNGATDNGIGWADIKNNKVIKCFISQTNGYTQGYFKLTGQNVIDKKNNERFFYESKNKIVTFSTQEANKYNELNKAQKSNAIKAFDSDNSDIASKEIKSRNNNPLAVGHLVYFEQNKKDNTAKNLGYVSIPRWKYENAIHDKIDKSFHPAEDADSLCPTSRIFGFVRDKKISEKKDNEGKSSYAGRVYFSDAKFDTSKGKVKYDENVVLDILGSPKPTTYEFYLSNPNNKSQTGDYNNANMKLRGRKFYLHQKNVGQYKRKFDTDENKYRTSQNSTLKRVLAEDNEFAFNVRFDNLDDHELGLLLWSLALEKGMAHKVGMGKPLGLGSVSIEVESVEIIEREIRYSSFFKDSNNFQNGITTNTNWQNHYLPKFTDWMKNVFGTKFNDLQNVKDLKKILEYPNSSTNPIHYPLCQNTDEKHFEWFVANRRNDHKVLPYPNEVEGVESYLNRTRKA